MRKDRGGHEGKARERNPGRGPGHPTASWGSTGQRLPGWHRSPHPKSAPMPQIFPLAPNLPPSIHTGWDTELPGRALFGVKTPTLGTLTNPMQLPFYFWGSPAPTGDRGCQEAAP